MRELAVLSACLVVYLLSLWVIDRVVPAALRAWFVLLVPNLWLVVASTLWIRRVRPRLARLVGGRRVWPGVLAAAVAATLLVAMTSLWPETASSGGSNDRGAIVRAGLLVALVPLAEELYFRGVLLDYLGKVTGSFASVILVSALFAFLHFPQGTALPMVVLSVLACLLVLASESMLWAGALHVGWNALALVRVAPRGADRWFIAGIGLALLIGLVLWGVKTRDRREAKE